MYLLLLGLITITCKLATAQQCSGRTRCEPPPPNMSGWVSRIEAPRISATSVQLEWDPDPEARAYQVAFRNVAAGGIQRFMFADPLADRTTSFNLRNLTPGIEYEALVCRPNRFDNTTVDPLGVQPCGFCFVCFRTDEVRFTFETTSISQLNDTHVSLTCQVNSNVAFDIEWFADISNSQRMRLVDRGRFDGMRISIMNNREVSGIQNGRDFTVTSVLVAPNSILGGDLECGANSPFGQRTLEFEDSSAVLSISEIAVAVVIPVLFITCVVGVSIGVTCSWAVHRHKNKKEKYKEVTEPSLRQKGRPNNYVSDHVREVCAGSSLPEDTRQMSLSGMISTSDTLKLPDDMILDQSMLDVSTVIGQGEFGVVYKGVLKKGATNTVVAVKSLKGIFVSEGDVQNTLKEILKMKSFDHPNVMTLIGVCNATAMSGGAPSIIMPYMAQGSLLNHLRKERDALMLGVDTDITQVGAVQKLLMQICLQISKGMAYLAALRFVHRDLAARNCMIDEKGIIKVSDFGLTEDIYMKNYFQQSSQDTVVKLPLKWMAPESIKLGIFSEKSDIWSYGVTCWEVFTAGEIPYPGIHPQAVMQLLDNGQHLSRPKNQACCDSMYGLMHSCWASRPEDRPEFDEVVSSLDKELTTLAEYIDLTMFTKDGV